MKLYIKVFCVVCCLTSCDAIIEIEDISKETVSVLAPKNNTVLDTIAVSFTWKPIEEAEAYHLQVAIPNFEDAQQIVKDSLLTTTSFSTSLQASSYEWRIRGENSAYVTAYTTQHFTIED